MINNTQTQNNRSVELFGAVGFSLGSLFYSLHDYPRREANPSCLFIYFFSPNIKNHHFIETKAPEKTFPTIKIIF